MEYVLDMDKTTLLLNKEHHISDDKVAKLSNMIERHKGGEPIEYIINTGFFMGLEFYVDDHVLIPRADTECLVELVVDYIKEQDKSPVDLIDMCTGSGCIAISLAKLTQCRVTAVDISEDAIYIAKLNAQRNDTQVNFVVSDLFEQITHKVDIIVSNPPYISSHVIPTLEKNVKNYEPMLALDGGESGVEFYERLAISAKNHLNPAGVIFMEIGYDQGERVRHLFEAAGYQNVVVKQDYSGTDRIVIAHV